MKISRHKYNFVFIMLTSISIFITSCAAPSSLVVWAARPMIKGAMQALMSESDLELAKSGFESNLKLIDGFLEVEPEDYQLLTLAAKGYAGYALIYLEDQDPVRASKFYQRSISYGFRALTVTGYDLHQKGQSFKEFSAEVSVLKSRDINAVYWTALAWAGKLNLNRNKVYAIAEFPRVLTMMEWIHDIDADYFYSGPLWFFGRYYASIPEMIGGDITKSKIYFDIAIEEDGDNFLLGKVWVAKYYSVKTMDRKLFLSTLSDVVSKAQLKPTELRLINSYARNKATDLLSQVDLIFD